MKIFNNIIKACVIILVFSSTQFLSGQQVADEGFDMKVARPVYPPQKGPVIFIDEGHNNFHTLSGRYKPFADYLSQDGYRLQPLAAEFTIPRLAKGKILVIANALHKSNINHWQLPCPSAFTKDEIQAVKKWVTDGGSLFLIADHMPMPGAAAELAAAFGFTMYNGFAMPKDKNDRGPAIFSRKDQTLQINAITQGRGNEEMVETVASFTGQAFEIPEDATSIICFKSNYIQLLPQQAWRFNKDTKHQQIEGFSQGAFKTFGRGRVVVFGEAAMFTSQRAGNQSFGLSHPQAKGNAQLLLNIIHWLDGILE